MRRDKQEVRLIIWPNDGFAYFVCRLKVLWYSIPQQDIDLPFRSMSRRDEEFDIEISTQRINKSF